MVQSRGSARGKARAGSFAATRCACQRIAYPALMVNINDPIFDEPREHPGFRCLRARLSRHAGSERLGLSLWEVPPGEAAYPYHYHLAEEELVVVLAGTLSLRTPDGWRELSRG